MSLFPAMEWHSCGGFQAGSPPWQEWGGILGTLARRDLRVSPSPKTRSLEDRLNRSKAAAADLGGVGASFPRHHHSLSGKNAARIAGKCQECPNNLLENK